MALTLSTILSKVKSRLGSDIEFTDAQITEAANTAQDRLLSKYDIYEGLKESTIVFTSGVGSLPSDYLRVYLESDSEDSVPRTLWSTSYDPEDFVRVSPRRFDEEEDQTWTIKGNYIYIYPADSATLNIRYFYKPTDMSTSGDSIVLPSELDEAYLLQVVVQLLKDDRKNEQAQMKQAELDRLMEDFMARQAKQYGARKNNPYSNINHAYSPYTGGANKLYW